MQVVLTAHHDEQGCTWCEKSRECVTVTFDDGFLKNAPLCWGCLQKAVKVRSRQTDAKPPANRSTS
ncbi:MAG: hypothetical protein WED34_09345 [Planctomycetales bacterium]